jgi:hypothetical protein
MDQTSGVEVPVHLLVDFAPRAGLKNVTSRPEALAARSAAAVDAAMASIHDMADRVTATVSDLVRKPDEVKVEFGIKLDAEAGALIAKSKIEAHIVVTLRWSDDELGRFSEDSGNS